MKKEIVRTERGWAGHFIAAGLCQFRRNTLLENDNLKIVISTVGAMFNDKHDDYMEIGLSRYYETMVFEAKYDGRYWNADVKKELKIESDWEINKISYESDKLANEMHENVIAEVIKRYF